MPKAYPYLRRAARFFAVSAYRLREAADLLGVSDDTVRRWAASGRLEVSTDASGRLIRLFTTNRWVTDETWSDAGTVIGMLDRFDVTADKPSPELNRWVSATLRMFRPQIVDLIEARDARIAQFKAAHPDSDVYEDRALQVTSEIPVDFLAQIRAIETALEAST